MRGLVVGVLVLGACIESSLVPCGDLSCPVGTACDAVHTRCVGPEQASACDGKAELDDCEAPGLTGGCFDGVCFPRGCGNGFLESTEMCDDGNQLSGDGCRSDCMSDERCGNLVVDPGETCDDGNLRSHDGCDSRCLAEVETWTVTPIAPRLVQPAAAYDVGRNVFATLSAGALYEVAGSTWSKHALAGTSLVGLYYDAGAGRMIVLGSTTGVQQPIQRFSWDGMQFTELASINPPMSASAATYDVIARRALMLTAQEPGNSRVLWSYDATGWHGLSLVLGLPGAVAFGFDPYTQQPIVLSKDGSTMKEWRYTGETWIIGPTPIPVVAGETGDTLLVQHTGRNRLIGRFGGILWERRPLGWTQLASGFPSTNTTLPVAYDSSQSRIVIADGSARVFDFTTAWSARPRTAPNDPQRISLLPDGHDVAIGEPHPNAMWTTSTDTLPLAPFDLPPRIAASADLRIVLDPHEGRLILTAQTTPTSIDTWQYKAGSWTMLSGEPLTVVASLTYDPHHARVLALGQGGLTYGLETTGWTRATEIPANARLTTLAWDAGLALLVGATDEGIIYDLTPTGWLVTLSFASPYAVISNPARASVIFIPNIETRRVWERRNGNYVELVELPVGITGTAITNPRTGALVMVGATSNDSVIAVHRWSSSTPDETCGPTDGDGDGLVACADEDCWWMCTPACPPETSCP